jgi:tetratricopeptide (TPR) repeat protein
MSEKSEKKAGGAVPPCIPASSAGEVTEGKDSRRLKSESFAAGWNDRWLVLGVCLFLAAITFAVFGQTLRHEFINYDDDRYVYENSVVQKGLTWEGFRWALTYGGIGHWHPLTWMSHMLDCQLYGMNAGGHHLTNVLLHTASVILLFLVLRRMTGLRPEKSIGATTPQAGVLWRCAFVAAVFAIHPLRAESVAWVAERKDVLSAFFFMLTLWAYVRYVQDATGNAWQVTGKPAAVPATNPSPATRHPSLFYGLVLLFFALGLLSKNMLVTMPFVLLLLDYWPLNRLSDFSVRVLLQRVVEKIPLLVLAVGSCVVTVLVPEKVLAGNRLSFALRMENAVVSYVTYLWQMIHPSGLACLYPDPTNHLPLWQVAGALGLLLAISGAAWAFRRTHPWFVVGWLWYLGMMVPVIGIVQISYYGHADRYTYLPQIGLYLMLTWGAAELCAGWRHRRVVLGVGSAIILAALIFCARAQTAYWLNSESLWTHTIACTSDNAITHNNLGGALLQKGRVDEAMVHFQQALQIKLDFAEAHNNLGNALLHKGGVDDAMVHLQQALQISPDYADAHYNLGNALFQKGRVDEAMVHYQKALQINPIYAVAHNNLGYALFQKGVVDEAIVHYQQALQISPEYAEAHNNLANALLHKGAVDEAIVQYQQALQINPDYAEAHNNLGYALFQKGAVDDAIVHYQKALQIKPDYAEAHYTLGNVLINKGRVDEAMVHYQQALQIRPEYAEAHNNLANALLHKGAVDEAIVHYQKALQINPDYAEAHNNLGYVLFQKGAVDEAMVHFQQALQIKPDYADAHNILGNVLLQRGRVDEAMVHFQKALQIKPDSVDVLNNLAWLRATSPDAHIRDGVQAVKYAVRACELTHYGVTPLVGTLAAAYAEAGRFDDAIATAEKACALATAAGEQDWLEKNQKLLALYRAHQPYREASEKLVPVTP